MATTDQAYSDKVNQAFNDVVKEGFNVFDRAWKQTTGMSETLMAATQAEQVAASQYLDQLAAQAGKRNESLAACFKSAADRASNGQAQAAEASAHQQQLLQDLLEQDQEAYRESVSYLTDWGERQKQLAKTLIESNFTALDSAQQLSQNAFNLGAAYLDLWQETCRRACPGSSA